jgi:hypothetical protein
LKANASDLALIKPGKKLKVSKFVATSSDWKYWLKFLPTSDDVSMQRR